MRCTLGVAQIAGDEAGGEERAAQVAFRIDQNIVEPAPPRR